MARRRIQHPTPFKEGNFWWLRVWDTSATGSRKRQRIKLANADMAVREVEKIGDEMLRPMNQGLGLTGSAMNFGDFMNECTSHLPATWPQAALRTFPAARGLPTAA